MFTGISRSFSSPPPYNLLSEPTTMCLAHGTFSHFLLLFMNDGPPSPLLFAGVSRLVLPCPAWYFQHRDHHAHSNLFQYLQERSLWCLTVLSLAISSPQSWPSAQHHCAHSRRCGSHSVRSTSNMAPFHPFYHGGSRPPGLLFTRP